MKDFDRTAIVEDLKDMSVNEVAKKYGVTTSRIFSLVGSVENYRPRMANGYDDIRSDDPNIVLLDGEKELPEIQRALMALNPENFSGPRQLSAYEQLQDLYMVLNMLAQQVKRRRHEIETLSKVKNQLKSDASKLINLY